MLLVFYLLSHSVLPVLPQSPAYQSVHQVLLLIQSIAIATGSSGLQAFQEQQERAKAVTLGAAPPTMPLAQTTTPSMFG